MQRAFMFQTLFLKLSLNYVVVCLLLSCLVFIWIIVVFFLFFCFNFEDVEDVKLVTNSQHESECVCLCVRE